MGRPIPVVDLFAGPGGLCEGFSSVRDREKTQRFQVLVSIEKDPIAHQTLSLRALFRYFAASRVPDCYYDYIQGDISREELLAHSSVTQEALAAYEHAKKATLGETPRDKVDRWIREAIGDSDPWVLIGGPPCQAYSLAGRSRMRRKDPKAFEEDNRHFLYKEYLRIIRKFHPAVFVMENVKGLLSSTHGGSPIFQRILDDLSRPGNGHEYEIRSFVVPNRGQAIKTTDFIIEAENYAVPQTRHRVILFGVRRDLAHFEHDVLRAAGPNKVSVQQAISGLPPLRSILSKEEDSFDAWLQALKEAPRSLKGWRKRLRSDIEERMSHALTKARLCHSTGGRFLPGQVKYDNSLPADLKAWFHDSRLGGVSLHQTRAHMRSDLHRYLFASCYAAQLGTSPRLTQFPPGLLPDHANLDTEGMPFNDRFCVQLAGLPSRTVVSHISKDGHYYIHPDPWQCRSFTVREAARLQTFPDNYFFEGNKTQQYVQVGNAVPPYLARQIAEVVSAFLSAAADVGTRARHRKVSDDLTTFHPLSN